MEICLILFNINLEIKWNQLCSFENVRKPVYTWMQKLVGAKVTAPVAGLLQLWHAFTAGTLLTCSCGQKNVNTIGLGLDNLLGILDHPNLVLSGYTNVPWFRSFNLRSYSPKMMIQFMIHIQFQSTCRPIFPQHHPHITHITPRSPVLFNNV